MDRRTFLKNTAATGFLIAQSAGALAEAPQATPFPFCSWWTETTATTVNVAFPDTNAAYWTTPFAVTNDLTAIIVDGQYVDGRYFSVTAYNNSGGTYTCPNSAGESEGSELTDFEIAPDQGSENPFQVSVPPPPTGTYTAMLEHPLAVSGSNRAGDKIQDRAGRPPRPAVRKAPAGRSTDSQGV